MDSDNFCISKIRQNHYSGVRNVDNVLNGENQDLVSSCNSSHKSIRLGGQWYPMPLSLCITVNGDEMVRGLQSSALSGLLAKKLETILSNPTASLGFNGFN